MRILHPSFPGHGDVPASGRETAPLRGRHIPKPVSRPIGIDEAHPVGDALQSIVVAGAAWEKEASTAHVWIATGSEGSGVAPLFLSF